MLKKFLLLLLLFSISIHGQFNIKGTINPVNNYTWILLYKLENGKKVFVNNANIENGKFQLKLSEKEPNGIYRAYYQLENNLYVEFIYNDEEVTFNFDPNNPSESIEFTSSQENIIFQDYHKTISSNQKTIDSIQVDFFRSNHDKTDETLIKKYQKTLTKLQNNQDQFEKKSKGLLANHFIKASAQNNASIPFKNPQDYLITVKSHFFDAIAFQDTVLSNSSFINDRLTDYVFYLNQANDQESKNTLHKKAITDAVNKVGDNPIILKNFEESLLQNYVELENNEMVNFVMNNFYNNLPDTYQDAALQFQIAAAMKTAIGKKATDFSWEANGHTKNLYSLIGQDYYIVVFFSSGCPHCQVEIPEFHNFIKEIENIKVISIGLEDEKEAWEKMTENYNEFTNILDLDKWNSQKVKDYGITAIPSYFVLDANKNILAKPNDFEELKTMFETK